MKRPLGVCSLGVALLALASCGEKSSNLGLPLVLPPVKAATPTGLQMATRGAARALDPADFRSRFFTTGPTNIFSILQGIDDRIKGFNTASGSHPCTTATPVAYNITPWGKTITLQGQCSQTRTGSFAGDPGITIFGVKDGVFHLYDAGGQSWTAATATPITGASGKYSVHAWIGVGYGNGKGSTGNACDVAWDNCSYGVIEIRANEETKQFEMAVAGIGFGYCGAQYVSDNTNVYGKGSSDMGTNCNAVSDICVKASDASTTATCTPAQQTFSLDAIGRLAATGSGLGTVAPASWGASQYPGTATVKLEGKATDSLYFGPTTVPAGIAAF